MECNTGQYQAKAASTSCEPCPQRHTTVQTGSKATNDCLGKQLLSESDRKPLLRIVS